VPQATIITATLNRPSLVEACASVDAQSYRDWHHFVLGDGVLPVDAPSRRRSTIGFSRALGADEPGVNMPEGTPNPILRWALQHLDLADYVCFLDDDNTYRPAFLQTMLSTLQANPTAGIVLCALRDHRYQRIIPGFPDGRCDNSGFLARREVVKRIPFPPARPDREVLQDCDFIAMCAEQAGWTRVPEVLVDFGINDNTPPGRGKVKWLESWAQPLRAVQRIRQGDPLRAAEQLAKAVQGDPRDAWALWHLGEALLVAGVRQEALNRWSRWLELFDDHGIAHDWIQYCAGLAHAAHGRHAECRRKVEEALDMLEVRIVHEPGNEDNRLNEGLYRLLLGQVGRAREVYGSVLARRIETPDLEAADWKLVVLDRAVPDYRAAAQVLNTVKESLDRLAGEGD
jgi:hypothetical protein